MYRILTDGQYFCIEKKKLFGWSLVLYRETRFSSLTPLLFHSKDEAKIWIRKKKRESEKRNWKVVEMIE